MRAVMRSNCLNGCRAQAVPQMRERAEDESSSKNNQEQEHGNHSGGNDRMLSCEPGQRYRERVFSYAQADNGEGLGGGRNGCTHRQFASVGGQREKAAQGSRNNLRSRGEILCRAIGEQSSYRYSNEGV